MLKIITILTLLYFLSSTALPQSGSDYDAYQRYNALNNKQPLPLQLADLASRRYYGSGGKQIKPCPRQLNPSTLNISNQDLHPTPTYSARVVQYQDSSRNNLKPQSLKNIPSTDEEYDDNDSVLDSYHHSKGNAKDLYEDKTITKSSKKDKLLKALNNDDDSSEASDRNALHNEKEDSVKYSNQKKGAKDMDLNESRNNDSSVKFAKLQSELPLENKNTNTKTGKGNDDLKFEKNLQADNSPVKSLNKYLTLAQDELKALQVDDEEVEKTNDSVKKVKALRENEHLFGKHAENKYYSQEQNEKSKGKTNADNDHAIHALYGVLLNKADSDELNEALYEMRTHLAHSDELINALKEVGEKGKSYSDVLNDALLKVKKHKDRSNERADISSFETSGESDSSDAYSLDVRNTSSYPKKLSEKKTNKEDKSSPKILKSGLSSSSDLVVSDEDDRKCLSKQNNLSAKQLNSTNNIRRFLSDSDDLVPASLSSTSNEDVGRKHSENKYKSLTESSKLSAQEDGLSKTKEYDSDKQDSQTSEEKEGDDDSDNLKKSKAGKQKSKYDLLNPAHGPGVSLLFAKGLSLMDHRRICYACSSNFDPSCLQPDRSTTVKYCHSDHHRCITKRFSDPLDNHGVVIRDCGDGCSLGSTDSGKIKNSCEVCDDDLCNNKLLDPNGAFSINSQSLMFTVFMILAIKFTL